MLGEVDVKPGERVTKGQPLARLRNLDLESGDRQARRRAKQYEAQLQNLLREGLHDRQSATQIPEVRKALKTRSENNSARRNCDQERLRPAGPVDGTVLPPPATTEHEDPGGPIARLVGHALGPGELRRRP